MSGNHLADQGQREYEKRGECPACHRGSLSPADYCPFDKCACTKGCEHHGVCNAMLPAAACDKCEYITTEEN